MTEGPTIGAAADAFNDALADLDGLIDLLAMLEASAEKPDLSNQALRPILASIRRAAGQVNAGLDIIDQMDKGESA